MQVHNVEKTSKFKQPAKWFQKLWKDEGHRDDAYWIDFYRYLTGDNVNSTNFKGGHVQKAKSTNNLWYIAALTNEQNGYPKEKIYKYDRELAPINISPRMARELHDKTKKRKS